ncbi:CutC family-domain-containing protein [Mycena galopus ATCC 62051]|nr:CutC family-domain-containing protein [Mycena galopus ATCC 62051]
MSHKQCRFKPALGQAPPLSTHTCGVSAAELEGQHSTKAEKSCGHGTVYDSDVMLLNNSTSTSLLCIEVCVDSVQSVLNAVRGGADRLEVCGNLGVSGRTTPSLGLLKAIQNSVDVPLMVMVRPCTGDFLYSEDEIEVMLKDIHIFKQYNVCGVVLGALRPDGQVDVEVMKRLVDEALPLQVCFHHAFDMNCNPAKALADVMNIGRVSRILTSGHGPTAPKSLDTLESLFEKTETLAKELP